MDKSALKRLSAIVAQRDLDAISAYLTEQGFCPYDKNSCKGCSCEDCIKKYLQTFPISNFEQGVELAILVLEDGH